LRKRFAPEKPSGKTNNTHAKTQTIRSNRTGHGLNFSTQAILKRLFRRTRSTAKAAPIWMAGKKPDQPSHEIKTPAFPGKGQQTACGHGRHVHWI
jgi:hypothetical protein